MPPRFACPAQTLAPAGRRSRSSRATTTTSGRAARAAARRELLDEGHAQQHANGAMLRAAYFRRLFPAEQPLRLDDLKIVSSNLPRTVNSAMELVRGFLGYAARAAAPTSREDGLAPLAALPISVLGDRAWLYPNKQACAAPPTPTPTRALGRRRRAVQA